jgi:hypothetical protein
MYAAKNEPVVPAVNEEIGALGLKWVDYTD